VLSSLFWDCALIVPKAEVDISLPKPSEPIALSLARPLVEFRYPLRAGTTAPTYRVSLG
jgi:hypothetical protein